MNIIITIVGHGFVARIAVDPSHDCGRFREGAHAALATIRRRGLVRLQEEVADSVITSSWEAGYAAIAAASLRSAKA